MFLLTLRVWSAQFANREVITDSEISSPPPLPLALLKHQTLKVTILKRRFLTEHGASNLNQHFHVCCMFQ